MMMILEEEFPTTSFDHSMARASLKRGAQLIFEINVESLCAVEEEVDGLDRNFDT